MSIGTGAKMAGCRMCGTHENLTKHHLLLKRLRRALKLPEAWVPLCRPCHDSLHTGPQEARRAAHETLRSRLNANEVAVLNQKPAPEWWEPSV